MYYFVFIITSVVHCLCYHYTSPLRDITIQEENSYNFIPIDSIYYTILIYYKTIVSPWNDLYVFSLNNVLSQ